VRATRGEWREVIAAFLVHRRIVETAARTRVGRSRAAAMVAHLRERMAADQPVGFAGPVEVDETYIGAQRKNQRLHIRRLYPPKRGHGTRKLPIVGAYDRATGTVRVEVMARKLDKGIVLDFVSRSVAAGARVFTDGFHYYRDLKALGYAHDWVDHNAKEYVRDGVHTNGIEGFWGVMKRTMGTIGGMRRGRLGHFAGEIAWRYNHRNCDQKTKERALLRLVLGG
jgi:hypothetical protein